MNKYIKIIIGLLFISSYAFGQIDSVKTKDVVPELPGDEVEVIKNFRARLARTNRIQFLPELPALNQTDIPYNYQVNVRGLSLDYPAPTIRPLAKDPDPKLKNYHTLAAFAYGYPRFSWAHLHSVHSVSDYLTVGLNYEHQAMANRNFSPVGFYEHTGDIFGQYTISDALSLNLGFKLDIDQHQLTSETDDYESFRRTNQYKGYAGISNADNHNMNVDYHLNTGFSNILLNDFDLSESWFDIDGGIVYKIGNVNTGVDIDYDFVNYDGDSLSGFNSLRLTPKVSYNTNIWSAEAGAQIVGENSVFSYLPQVMVKSKVQGTRLIVSAFVKSEVLLNNWHNSLDFNPFISNVFEIRNEKSIVYGAGVSGDFDRLHYLVEGGYKTSRDLLTYEKDLNSNFNSWNGVLIDANTPFISTVINFKINETVSLSTDFYYQNYRDSLGLDAEGLYDIEWGVGSEIRLLNNKLRIEPQVRLISAIERSVELDHNSFFDLGIDADYSIMDNLSVFLKSNNLLNSRNERWAGYQALGIAVAGGVKLRF